MNIDTLRYGIAAALLALAASCERSPVAPSPTSERSNPIDTPANTPAWPPVLTPARVYVGPDEPATTYHGSPLASRFVLHDDGSFALPYSSARHQFFAYQGTYREANGAVIFDWEGWSAAGPWGATATITDEALDVRYNLIMQLSDFVDKVYRRVQ